jgi:hypothetical protein
MTAAPGPSVRGCTGFGKPVNEADPWQLTTLLGRAGALTTDFHTWSINTLGQATATGVITGGEGSRQMTIQLVCQQGQATPIVTYEGEDPGGPPYNINIKILHQR